jgi:hypothetical protein
MNKAFAIATILTITALATSSAIPMASAKPLKTSEVINDLIDLSCSANHGILTCTVKSFSGGTIGPVILTQTVSGKLPLCDVENSTKKRISVTNRNSENCTDPFVEGQTLKITVIRVDGTVKNLEIEIAHKGDFLEFMVV